MQKLKHIKWSEECFNDVTIQQYSIQTFPLQQLRWVRRSQDKQISVTCWKDTTLHIKDEPGKKILLSTSSWGKVQDDKTGIIHKYKFDLNISNLCSSLKAFHSCEVTGQEEFVFHHLSLFKLPISFFRPCTILCTCKR